jgi:hypothetical protein
MKTKLKICGTQVLLNYYMMRTNYFLCVLLLFVSCNTESSRFVVEEFPIETKVIFDKIEVEPILYFVGDMLIVDDVLITVDMKNETFFHFFKLPELTSLGGQINRGEGPRDEVIIFPTLDKVENDKFAYRTTHKVKIVNFNKNDRVLQVVQQIELPDKYMGILNSFVFNKNIYGYNMLGEDNEKEFIRYDPVEEKVSEFGSKYPFVNMDVTEKKNTVFTKVMGGKPDGTMFAVLYDKFPILRIYDHEGKIISESEYNNNQKLPSAYTHQEMNIESINDLTINYMKIKVTDKYIYGLYSGKTHEESRTKQKQIDDYCCEVHVWDWKGMPIARYILEKPVSSFAVTPDDSYFLFYSFENENILYKVNIS